MPKRVPKKSLPEHSRRVHERLAEEYPDATCALRHENPLQLLIATILSAQCTDVRVNQVTPTLFSEYPTAQAFADAAQEDLERSIHSTGFFRNKAKNIIACCRAIADEHGGNVPSAMEDLTRLAGVGRKTANVVLGNAFGVNDGVVVDTHVARLAGRMGLSRATPPDKIEVDLMNLVPQDDWTIIAHRLIDHGRQVCAARKPKCDRCVLSDICPSAEL